ncbi:SDR family oxidoreductase [Wenjunlia tyrosinilytica]|uniref:Nucleotide-diphosphate-sugar epimerase n=1 Tax=Wenjunlia tyrosinilytica TaxID=1544741 RepID=A0A918DY06_9ACTN|nr:NAD(P)H-binding protein [Wenjunlia tyrosinilytica]GGO89405.1 nucleotide-diphosphate-sugar epimerase [Wenjunlia tyrosinilytica]
MTILVTGSRGRVGRSLVTLLHSRGLDVRAASGSPEELSLPDAVPTVKCSLADPRDFPAALDGITSVFLYAEASQIDAFLERALAAGVGHVVLLSSSAVLSPDAADDPIGRSHLAVEQALAASPIESTFLRPGAFATNALHWARPIRATGSIGLPYPGAHSDPIHEGDLVEAALAVLTDARLRGGRYHLTGPESLPFTDQIAHIARAAGRPITVNAIGPQDWKAANAKYIPQAYADALVDLWKASDGSPVETTRCVEELTGHPARPFALWARDHAGAFLDR